MPVTSPDAAGTASTGGPSLAQTFLRPFMKLAAVQPGERVLIFSPGTGEAAIEAALRSGNEGEALAVDLNQATLDSVAAQAQAAGARALRTARLDPEGLDLPTSYWDVVICHFGLTDLADPELALREAGRVLRPVGRLALSIPGERERCPLITLFLDAVAAHVPAAKGEALQLFRYSGTGRLAVMLAEQGFGDVVPDRSVEWVPFQDVDEYWSTMISVERFGRLARTLSDEAVAQCKDEITRRTRFYRRPTGIELKVEAVILAAVKGGFEG
jgi:SAM-dependent methyltransferase